MLVAARVVFVSVAVVLTFPSGTDAQVITEVPRPAAEDARRGIAAGLSLGAGSQSTHLMHPTAVPFLTSGRRSGPAVDAWGALYFTNRLALVGGVDVLAPAGGPTMPIVYAAVQHWPRRRMWVRAGVGWSEVDAIGANLFPFRMSGSAFSAAIGGSVADWKKASIDVSVRVARVSLKEVRATSAAVLLGFALWR